MGIRIFPFAIRLVLSLAAVGMVTLIGYALVPINATSVGFAYVLVVLTAATLCGFIEALSASLAATLALNFFFFAPVGRFTIADPQNWVALFSFLITSLVASRLSAEARRRTQDALESKQNIERLYMFSRAILLAGTSDEFPKQLVNQLADIFRFDAVVLYEKQTERVFRTGPLSVENIEDRLRKAAAPGTNDSSVRQNLVITAIRLGSEPIASLALQGQSMPDSVVQGIANLVAIGLERARAQDLASQIEAARQSEKLRTTLLDAMAHEFKTPLTSVMAATSSLRSDPDQPREGRVELVRIADEETRHLKELIDDSIEMGRLASTNIELLTEPADLAAIVQEILASIEPDLDTRKVELFCEHAPPAVAIDRRLVRLAIKQVIENALKYSPDRTPVSIHIGTEADAIHIDITDHGEGIPSWEQSRIFDRFYRSPRIACQVPGSGLGLSIAQNIARAHRGDLTVTSRPGETRFRFTFPVE